MAQQNDMLNQDKKSIQGKEIDQVLGGGQCWHQWEGRGGGEMGQEGEYGAKNVYTCM
jgi:hypothetical protein